MDMKIVADPPEQRRAALLLLGPTGSGKTPLGRMMESRGLGGVRCVHFDFGENLRDIVARNRPDASITRADIEFLRGVLASGALLEDEHFPLAERILRSFLTRRAASRPGDCPNFRLNENGTVPLNALDARPIVILNGLPRHEGQALAIDPILDIRAVVQLECPAEVVLKRLAANIGGDRSGRDDDTFAEVSAKLETYARRTALLVDYYRDRGIPIVVIPIDATTTPEEAFNRVRLAIREKSALPSMED